MLQQNSDSLSSADSKAVTRPRERRREAVPPRQGDEISQDGGALADAPNDQLAREIADIEAATAALRRAEPALQSWTNAPAAVRKPRPVWLLIGVLWLSTALVTAGAVVAIAAFAG
jgi:hypothetical protein